MIETLVDELQAVTEMQFSSTGTGGGCTALAALTETGHEILITDTDGQIPATTGDAVRVSAHSPDTGEILVTDRRTSASDTASLVLRVLGRIPAHADHYDEDGVIYCDQCPSAAKPFRTALGLI